MKLILAIWFLQPKFTRKNVFLLMQRFHFSNTELPQRQLCFLHLFQKLLDALCCVSELTEFNIDLEPKLRTLGTPSFEDLREVYSCGVGEPVSFVNAAG